MPPSGPFAYPHLRPDGNRILAGTGGLPTDPLTVDLGFEPAWLVSLPAGESVVWAAVGADGTTRGLRLADGEIQPFELSPRAVPAGAPPVLASGTEDPELVLSPTDGAAPLAQPFPLGDGRALLVGTDGAVLLWDGGVVDRLAVDALPDARFVRAGPDTFAVLAGATERYDHGTLGDGTEAGALVVFEVGDGLAGRARATFDPAVAEGMCPMAASLNGSEPTLIVTLTDADVGARLVSFDLGGERVATGPAVGTGFRWRHQLCVAPFGPAGATELAVVKTPHIGGVVEFYRRRGVRLEIVAERSGYSTHAFGSRNLDAGLAGDLDGDGAVELVVPTQARDELVAVRRTADGTEAPWQLPLSGSLSTNVAGVTTDGGRVVLGAGTADGTLRFWGAARPEA